MSLDVDAYRVRSHWRHPVGRFAPDAGAGLDKGRGKARFEKLRDRLARLHGLLYADRRFALLVVVQGMDTAGKDNAIGEVFAGCSPSGMTVTSFKQPTATELAHDYLWRVHAAAPARGCFGVFNRSHYEDVLVARVKGLAPAAVWERRYDQINAWERLLADEGTRIVKFYLHISREYQKQRLQRRLDNPRKLWKFDPADLAERARWEQYRAAYDDALRRCSTDHAPWYVVPAEHRWFRNLLMAEVLVRTLKSLKLRYPAPKFDPARIRIV